MQVAGHDQVGMGAVDGQVCYAATAQAQRAGQAWLPRVREVEGAELFGGTSTALVAAVKIDIMVCCRQGADASVDLIDSDLVGPGWILEAQKVERSSTRKPPSAAAK